MSLSDHYKGGTTERLAVQIVTCDPATSRLEGVGKDAAVIQISTTSRPPAFRWPKEGEFWIIVRTNADWTLLSRIEEDGMAIKTKDGQPGDLMGPDGWIPQHKTQPSSGDGLLWNGQDWVPTNLATQVELDAVNSALGVRATASESRLDALETQYGFYMRLENDVVNAFTNNTVVKVPMDTIVYDYSGNVSIVNDWFTVPKTGMWAFEGGALQTAAFTTGAITYQTTLSGSTAQGGAVPVFDTYFPPATSRKSVKGTMIIRCNAGDQVFVQFFQNSGVTLTADGAVADFNFLRGVFLGT